MLYIVMVPQDLGSTVGERPVTIVHHHQVRLQEVVRHVDIPMTISVQVADGSAQTPGMGEPTSPRPSHPEMAVPLIDHQAMAG